MRSLERTIVRDSAQVRRKIAAGEIENFCRHREHSLEELLGPRLG